MACKEPWADAVGEMELPCQLRVEEGQVAEMQGGHELNVKSSGGMMVEDTKLVSAWSRENVGLVVGTFFNRFTTKFFFTPIKYYILKDLGLDAQDVLVCVQMVNLPMAFQLFYGLMSDCVPIMGQRRKPYFILGWCLNVLAMAGLVTFGTDNFQTLCGLGFLSVVGHQLNMLVGNAMIAERSELEDKERAGHLMGTVSVAGTMGTALGTVLGTVLYNRDSWGWGMTMRGIALVNTVASLVFVSPCLYHLYDPVVREAGRSLDKEMRALWSTVQRRSVLLPLAYLVVSQLLLVANPSWDIFLVDGLHFDMWMVGLGVIVASVFGAVGATLYRVLLIGYSWRAVFIGCVAITVLFTVLQSLLALRLNTAWGVNDLFFSLSPFAVLTLVQSLQAVPINTMFVRFCAGGAKGASFALFSSLLAIAQIASDDIGYRLLDIYDCTPSAILRGDFRGTLRMTILCGALPLLSLPFLPLLPRDAGDQRRRQTSDLIWLYGGLLLVVCYVAAMCWTLALIIAGMYR